MISGLRAMLDAGRAEAALEGAKLALEHTPNDVEALAIRAEALLTLERWEEGLTQTELLIRACPDSVWGRRLQCVALENLGRFEEAIEVSRQALQLSPDEANVHFLLAQNLWQTSRDAAAITALRRAIELDPEAPTYRLRLAHFLFDDGRAEAEALLERIVADEPARAGALNDLGVLRLLRGDQRGALAFFVRALAIDPTLDVARRNRRRLDLGMRTALAVALFLAAVAGLPAVLAFVSWREGHLGWAIPLLVVALFGLLFSVAGTLRVLRARRALAKTPPERSTR